MGSPMTYRGGACVMAQEGEKWEENYWKMFLSDHAWFIWWKLIVENLFSLNVTQNQELVEIWNFKIRSRFDHDHNYSFEYWIQVKINWLGFVRDIKIYIWCKTICHNISHDNHGI